MGNGNIANVFPAVKDVRSRIFFRVQELTYDTTV